MDILIFLGVLAVAGVALVVAATRWDRYRRDAFNPRLQPTTEVFVDPETGIRMRVWYDPATGERRYVPEGPAPPAAHG